MAANGNIHVGIGGWTYEPWRGTFYPADWPKTRELEYASRRVTSIEINGTYYSTQKPESFARWRDETPDGFVFSVKAHRLTTNRRVLADAGDSVGFFVRSGIAELRAKLGPILWQFAPTKRFDAADFEAFLKLLPREVAGVPLRHVMEVRHPSFVTAEYVDLARRHGVATVFAHSDEYPGFADLSADFVYLRLQQSQSGVATGYDAAALDAIAACARTWAEGGEPAGVPVAHPQTALMQAGAPRDVFVYFIAGAKERAPAAAQALLERLR
jgi:uncharacterized protein YecE (DUF72 family)